MSTLPELQDIEATITKLRAERDQLGGTLVTLLGALGPRPQTRNPDELEMMAEMGAARLAAALRKAGADPGEVTPWEFINALAATVRRLTQDPGPAIRVTDEELNDLDAYGFVMSCAPGDARSASDPDGRAFTWDRSGD